MDDEWQCAVVLKSPLEYDYFCSLHPMMTGRIVVR
jgi:plastocyanin